MKTLLEILDKVEDISETVDDLKEYIQYHYICETISTALHRECCLNPDRVTKVLANLAMVNYKATVLILYPIFSLVGEVYVVEKLNVEDAVDKLKKDANDRELMSKWLDMAEKHTDVIRAW